MRQTVDDQDDEISDGLETFPSHKQDPASVLVQERVTETVVVVVVGRKVRCE